jgi:glycoside/pentoside/hexuronide:cation symporter, GPH family
MDINGKISVKEKVGYAMGDTASNLFWQTFSMFLLYFYTDVFGISAAAAGTMFLLTRIWDSVNDPIMGIIADRTTTRWGKFRPYLLWLALPFGVIGLLTFTTPDFTPQGKLIYAYITYTLMMMVYTAINIPYSALMGVVTPNSLERTSLSSYRFVAAFMGGLIVQASALRMVKFFGQGNEATGWQWTMSVFAGLAVALFIVTFLSTKERVQPPKAQKTSLKHDIKDLMANVPWVFLFIVGIFFLSYVSIRNGAIMYFFKYFVDDQTIQLFGKSYNFSHDSLAASFMVVGSAANIVGITLTRWFSNLLGKRGAFMTLMGVAAVLTTIFYFLGPEHVLHMFVLQTVISFASGPIAAIMWAMYADTADYSEYKTGRRATGLVFSASTMAQKLGWTIGGALAGWLLAAFGFQANTAQTAEAQHGIRLLISLIPAVGAVISLCFMFFYKLDEPTMHTIENELRARREQE